MDMKKYLKMKSLNYIEQLLILFSTAFALVFVVAMILENTTFMKPVFHMGSGKMVGAPPPIFGGKSPIFSLAPSALAVTIVARFVVSDAFATSLYTIASICNPFCNVWISLTLWLYKIKVCMLPILHCKNH